MAHSKEQNKSLQTSPEETYRLTYTIYKINSKLIKGLNRRAKTIQFLEENIGRETSWLITVIISCIWHQKHRQPKEKKNRQSEHQNLELCLSKDTINGVRRQHTEWENIFTNHISNWGLINI